MAGRLSRSKKSHPIPFAASFFDGVARQTVLARDCIAVMSPPAVTAAENPPFQDTPVACGAGAKPARAGNIRCCQPHG